MNPRLLYHILLLLFSVTFRPSFGQETVNRFPVRFSVISPHLQHINPATTGFDSRMSLASGHQNLLGNFSNVNTSYFLFQTRIKSQNNYKKTPFSSVGLVLYNDSEGKYLDRNRFYVNYAWHTNIAKKVVISGGFSLGGMNYNVKATELSAGGSDLVPDGSAGLFIYDQEIFGAGLSFNQIFESTVQPLEESAKLLRFVSLCGFYKYQASQLVSINSNLTIQKPFIRDYKSQLTLEINSIISSTYGFNLTLHNNNELGIGTSIHNFELNNTSTNIYFNYLFPVKMGSLKANKFEIGVQFRQRKK